MDQPSVQPVSVERPRRTVLAVPGSSQRFIDKARGLDADAIFLDLEDAVAPAEKVAARAQVVQALNAGPFKAPTLTVRVNAWDTPWTTRDTLDVVVGAGGLIDALLLPKVTDPAQVVALDLIIGQAEQEAGLPIGAIGVEAQIEDAAGLLAAPAIAGASPRLRSLVFGPGDYMASLGMGSLTVGAGLPGYPGDHFHHALSSVLVAARAYGLQAIDGPYVAISDPDGFAASAGRAAALGYDGKWVIHPSQIDAGNAAFTPDPAVVERAQRIVQAYEAATAGASGRAVGAIVVDGEMVDEAGVKVARRLLSRRG